MNFIGNSKTNRNIYLSKEEEEEKKENEGKICHVCECIFFFFFAKLNNGS